MNGNAYLKVEKVLARVDENAVSALGEADIYFTFPAIASAAGKSSPIDPAEWAFEGEYVRIISNRSKPSVSKNAILLAKNQKVFESIWTARELRLPRWTRNNNLITGQKIRKMP